MGFLDNLENDLKNAEAAAERDPGEIARQQAAREAQRAAALAAAPHAQQLRTSKFTADLLNHAAVLGRGRRLHVRVAWVGPALRLQAQDHVLELQPTPEGIVARFLRAGAEAESFPVELSSSAEALAHRWLDSITAESDKPAH
ncbi:MAG TPA: hypothetical protein VEU62_04710 [Bryobacterales bacterium]|nr:hypothetical protein [Bryobacterales bacterium]